MSVKIMGQVFDLELEPTMKFILIAYVDHADHNGNNIYPSVATIAKKTGYSERTVQRITRELEESGYLIADGKGKTGTNKWKYGGGDTVSGVTPEAQGGDNSVTRGVTTTTKGGDIACHPNRPLTVIKPSINQENIRLEICKLFNYSNASQFELGLTTTQKEQIEPLLEKDPEKCYRIAEYYVNEGMYFKKVIGRIINNFNTWRDEIKQETRKKARIV